MGLPATDEELQELGKIAVSGVQSVETAGRKIVYRPQADLERAYQQASASKTGRKRRRYFAFSRGY